MLIYLATTKGNSFTYHYFYKKNWIFQVEIYNNDEKYYYRWQHIVDCEIEECNGFHYVLPETLNIIDTPNNIHVDISFYYLLDDIITNKILESI
jgi:hypothetical protein